MTPSTPRRNAAPLSTRTGTALFALITFVLTFWGLIWIGSTLSSLTASTLDLRQAEIVDAHLANTKRHLLILRERESAGQPQPVKRKANREQQMLEESVKQLSAGIRPYNAAEVEKALRESQEREKAEVTGQKVKAGTSDGRDEGDSSMINQLEPQVRVSRKKLNRTENITYSEYPSPMYDNITFASLNLCDDQHPKYFCENDPTCQSVDCIHNHHLIRFGDPDNYKRFWATKETRRTLILNLISRMTEMFGYNMHRNILLLTFNAGFAHLFGNWYCSLLANGINVDEVKKSTIVIATDRDSIRYAQQLGFFVPDLTELMLLKAWSNLYMTRKAADAFGRGSHSAINLLLKIALPLDFIMLGYSVIVQDVDLIWGQNLFNEIPTYCTGNCSAVFIHEKRPVVTWRQMKKTDKWRRDSFLLPNDGYPEVNTGLFYIRPNAATKHLLKILLNANRLQQWKNRDQLLYNAMLYHKAFSHVHFNLLPADRFVPGKYTRRVHLRNNNTIPVPPRLSAIHVSDTTNYIRKYHRFVDIGHWYFNESTCPEPVELCKANDKCWEPMQTIFETPDVSVDDDEDED